MITNSDVTGFLSLYEPKVEVIEKPEVYQSFPIVDIRNFINEPLWEVQTKQESSKFYIIIDLLLAKLKRNRQPIYSFYSQNKDMLDTAKTLVQQINFTTRNFKKPKYNNEGILGKTTISKSNKSKWYRDQANTTRSHHKVNLYSLPSIVGKPPLKLLLNRPKIYMELIDNPITEEYQRKIPKRIFTVEKFNKDPLLKPNRLEISKEELQNWRDLYRALNGKRELDIRSYMDYLIMKPNLKKLMDLYLLHRKVAPNADCKFDNIYSGDRD